MTPHQKALQNLDELAALATLNARIQYARDGRSLVIHKRQKRATVGSEPMKTAE